MESQTNDIDSNKQKFNLQAVFPTPIYIAKLERNIVKTELDFCHAELKKSIKNISNLSSQNQYVLENEPFRDLKIWFEDHLQLYMENVYSPKNDLKLVITTSWLNQTKDGQSHHQHSHPNSVVSGVFYFAVNGKTDQIKFEKPFQNQFLVEIDKNNFFNTETVFIGTSPGVLLLFPSMLQHSVPTISTKSDRISLSFNTYFKGVVNSQFACKFEV